MAGDGRGQIAGGGRPHEAVGLYYDNGKSLKRILEEFCHDQGVLDGLRAYLSSGSQVWCCNTPL